MQTILANRGTLEIPMTENEKISISKRVGHSARISLIKADPKTNTFVFEASGSKCGPCQFRLPNFQWLDAFEEETDDHFQRWMNKRTAIANVPRQLAMTTCAIFNHEQAISALSELKEFYDSATPKQRQLLLNGTNSQRMETIKKLIGGKLAYKFKLDKLNSNRVKAIAFYLCGKSI